ncbi:hypothetical protein RND81_07G141100 [Saponaria officinalis]|uniref:Uncharacterized protein n=1 Tax=Saponaria officinalis TaxID=3572 RepID=A0AAW1JS32_SAPOF
MLFGYLHSLSPSTTPTINIHLHSHPTTYYHYRVITHVGHHSPTSATRQNSSLKFKVTRHEAELIQPAKLTPNESLQLSDLDSVNSLRAQLSLIHFYKNRDNIDPYLSSLGPSKVIKDAIAKALVSYYPLAGRIRETGEGKLVVECTGEGVLFVDACVDVTLETLRKWRLERGFILHFLVLEELVYDGPGSSGIVHYPLFIIQVTRLKCGGFILALKFIHIMIDGSGLVQFLNAVAEFAHGTDFPSISPVWNRHLIITPNSTQFSHSFDHIESFFFGPTEMSKLRHSVPQLHVGATNFELITAHIWRSRAMALYKV